ncbi:MAG: hypothetical protein GY866_08460 [Proteobacteria bacterium]|nr:hypothetical protein [Pseudomonadota bacterium]
MLKDAFQNSNTPGLNFRLALKMMFVVGFIIVIVIAVLNYFFLHKLAESKIDQIKEMANTTSIVVSELALSSFYDRDQARMKKAMDNVFRESTNQAAGLLQVSVILFPSGIYYASTTKEFQNKKVGQSLLRKIELNTRSGTVSEMLNYEVDSRTIPVLQFLRNVVVAQKGEEKRIATIQILFDYGKILNKTREYLLIVGGIILLSAFIMIWIVYLPIMGAHKKLIEAFNQISRHNFNFTLQTGGNDDFGVLFNAFNRMVVHLQQYFGNKLAARSDSLGGGDSSEISSLLTEQSARKAEITCLCARIPEIQECIESDSPDSVADLILKFSDPFEKTVQECGGQVVKILGDKIYALFEGMNSIDNSIRTAVKVNQEWKVANHESKVLNRKLKNYGIGLHSAEGIAGTFGRTALNYTFIGRSAIVAEYLCSCAKREEILVSSSMMDKANVSYQLRTVSDPTPYNLPQAEEVFLITDVDVDKGSLLRNDASGASDLGALEADRSGQSDNLSASSSAVIHAKPARTRRPSVDSSITDMLEETLENAPLESIGTEELSGGPFDKTTENGRKGKKGEESSRKQQSLWEEFNSRIKDEKK